MQRRHYAKTMGLARFFWVLFSLANLSFPLQAAPLKTLAQDPYWHKLLHYRPQGGGYLSPIGSKDFFLSPQGPISPEAELASNLTAFTTKPNLQCQFPARARWLKKQLPDLSWGQPECPLLDQWLAHYRPQKLSLIYAASFMGNPGSAFGHLFLKLDQGQDSLNDPVVQFAARTGDAAGFEYLYLGVFGGFDGFYSLEPLHQMLKSNLELDDRDLYEYPIDLDPAAVEVIMLHLYELQERPIAYYFFLENCGYRLLELIELGFDGSEPFEKSRLLPYSIPTDAAKELINKLDLTGKHQFYPSRSRRFYALLAQLDAPEKKALDALLATTQNLDQPHFTNLSAPSKARVLDEANHYQRIKLNSRLGQFEAVDWWLGIKEAQNQIRQERLKLLSVRASLGEFPEADPALPPGIEAAHGSARIGFGGFAQDQRQGTLLYGWLAYHDLLSRPTGYLPYTELKVFDFKLEQTQNQIRLTHLKLIEVLDLTPRDRYFKPWAWRLFLGWQTQDPLKPPVFQGLGQMGLSSNITPSVLVYGLAGPGFWEQGFYIEGRGGFVWQGGETWALQGYAQSGSGPQQSGWVEARFYLGQAWETYLGWNPAPQTRFESGLSLSF